jgi:hypothetical protein
LASRHRNKRIFVKNQPKFLSMNHLQPKSRPSNQGQSRLIKLFFMPGVTHNFSLFERGKERTGLLWGNESRRRADFRFLPAGRGSTEAKRGWRLEDGGGRVGRNVRKEQRNSEWPADRRDLAAQDRRHPTHVLGFVTNMHELMAVSDLLITKPGGLTASEALALGKPLFILNPIPGQEAANSDFLLEHAAAAKANRVEELPFRLDQLLGSKKLADMARAAKALGRPAAAADICRAVTQRLAARLLP